MWDKRREQLVEIHHQTPAKDEGSPDDSDVLTRYRVQEYLVMIAAVAKTYREPLVKGSEKQAKN